MENFSQLVIILIFITTCQQPTFANEKEIKECKKDLQCKLSSMIEEVTYGFLRQNYEIEQFFNDTFSSNPLKHEAKEFLSSVGKQLVHSYNYIINSENNENSGFEAEVIKCIKNIVKLFQARKVMKLENGIEDIVTNLFRIAQSQMMKNAVTELEEFSKSNIISAELGEFIDKIAHLFKKIENTKTHAREHVTDVKEPSQEVSQPEAMKYFNLQWERNENKTEILRILTREVEQFYKFLQRDSAFVHNDQTKGVASTITAMTSFIKNIEKCINVLEVYGNNAGFSVMTTKLRELMDDFKRFSKRAAECETRGEEVTNEELEMFFSKIEELRENLIITYELINGAHAIATENSTVASEYLLPTSSSVLNDTDIFIANFYSYIENFNEDLCTLAELENLERQLGELITTRENITSTIMQAKADGLVERARHLLERTRRNYLKNYTRLQQLMNIVKEKMSEELVYRGDMEVLDKHIFEINALLPRVEQNYRVAASSLIDSYEVIRRVMQERNAAMIELESITSKLKEGDFAVDGPLIQEKLMYIASVFDQTEYSKMVETVYNKLNLIINANDILNIASDILNDSSSKNFQLNLQQIHTVKQKVLVIMHTTRNGPTKKRASLLYERLLTRLRIHDQEIMEKLKNISAKLLHIEALDSTNLEVLSKNLKSIIRNVDNVQIVANVQELLAGIKSIEARFADIENELQFIETILIAPLDDSSYNQLKLYLGILTDLSRFREPSIATKVKKLDAVIRKLIYDYQVKNELREINRELNGIEHTGSDDINDNIMRLQNLEIKVEDEETDDVQEVLDNIHQMRNSLRPRVSASSDDNWQNEDMEEVEVLNVIAHEIVSITQRTISQIIDLNSRLAQLEQTNKSQVVAALRNRVDVLETEINQIALDMDGIGEKLSGTVFLPALDNENQPKIFSQKNGSTMGIIDQLLRVNYTFNDSHTSSLYESMMSNVEKMKEMQSVLQNVVSEIEEWMNGSQAQVDVLMKDRSSVNEEGK